MNPSSDSITRRSFVTRCTGALAAGACMTDILHAGAPRADGPPPHQATGTRTGEITDTTAIVWARLSSNPTRNNDGKLITGRAQDYKDDQLPQVTVPVDQLEGPAPACPGAYACAMGPISF